MAKSGLNHPVGVHLLAVTLPQGPERPARFPFSVPAVAALDRLAFTTQVTFLVGENGCGKSTLLEAIAAAAGTITVGREDAASDPTLAALRPLANAFRLSWSRRTHRGFYLRAEDFFGYANRLGQMRSDLQHDLEAVDEEYRDRSATARGYAKMAYSGQLSALRRDYGEGLDSGSHGENYLRLFQRRFVPGGLYLLDEPEAPLSPTRQLAFLLMLKQMTGQDAQFIIATHSPILMAFPGATILQLDGERIVPVSFDEVEHVSITRTFLANPEQYLRHLFDERAPGGDEEDDS